MRLLFVIDSLGSGGAQRQFVNIVNGLARFYDVEVLLYHANSDFYRNDLLSTIPLHSVKRENQRGFSFEVLKALRHHMGSADVVLSFLPTANIYVALASGVSFSTRQIACEMSVVNETENRARRWSANLANFRARHVICNSFTQAEYIRSLPGMAQRVSTVWNGCADLNFLSRSEKDRLDLKLIVVGRLAHPKNGLRLVQALRVFHERNGFLPHVSWAGRDDSDERSKLMKKQMVAFLEESPEVSERFKFLGEVADIGSLFATSDALLSPSVYEGVPVVICEAMLSGCPVIASRVSDNERILGKDEERGFLCDPLSPMDICQAIERYIGMSPDRLLRMTESARLYAEHHFSIEQMVAAYRDVIKAVTA